MKFEIDYSVFSTPKDMPFVYWKQAGIYGTQYTLAVEDQPITEIISFNDLFTDMVASPPKAVALISVANEIARLARRGPGNIFFVADEESQEYFKKVLSVTDIDVHVMPSLQKNELRGAYWKGMGKAVDGGIQFSPSGFSRLPDTALIGYKNYFVRCFYS